ncbi:MAG TPA: insulinase family protein [Gemmatimonadales bacterium]|nr:insulinase family protein [Gemmatimonadales bacterium]
MIPLLATLLLSPARPDTSYVAGGVTVIQRVDTTTRLAAIGLYLLGGTRILTPKTAGIEQLFIRTAWSGTRKYPQDGGTRTLARTGAFETIQVEADWTTIWLQGFAADFDTAWSVLADQMTNPTFSDTAFALAHKQLLAAARTRYQDPQERIRALADSVMFAGHPYALDPRGTVSSIEPLTVSDVQQFQRREMVTSRMLLVVVGNISPHHVEELVQSTLGGLPHGSYNWTLPPLFGYREGRAHWVIEHRLLPTTYLLGYCPGPEPSSPLYWSFRIMNSIYSGWLGHEIRGRGLSYAAYAPFLDRALPIGGFEMSTNAPDRAYPLALGQLRDLADLDMSTGGDEAYTGADSWLFWSRAVKRSYLQGLRFEQATVLGGALTLARAQLLYGDYRKLDAMAPGHGAFEDRNLANAAAWCRTHMDFAYLGDTTKMKGQWKPAY